MPPPSFLNVLCQLAAEGLEESAAHTLVTHMGLPLNMYHVKVLKKVRLDVVEKNEPSLYVTGRKMCV